MDWSPPVERTTLAPLAYSGCYAGFMLGMPFCQYFAQSISLQYPFIYSSFIGIVWFLLWVFSTSEKSTEDELTEDQIAIIYSRQWQTCSMFLPVWVICIAGFCLLIVFQAYIFHISFAVDLVRLIIFYDSNFDLNFSEHSIGFNTEFDDGPIVREFYCSLF